MMVYYARFEWKIITTAMIPVRIFVLALIALVLSACQVTTQAAQTASINYTATPTIAPETASPTPALPLPVVITPHATEPATTAPTNTASPTITRTPIPTNTKRPPSTATPTRAVTQISTLVPGPLGGDLSATWTPMPSTSTVPAHFLFKRPISDAYHNYWARNYAFGSTDHGSRPVHHGVDLENSTGTPVLAAGDGKVFYAGPDNATVFGPQPNFYGNVIVIEHPFQYSNGKAIYTLYGHLSSVEVETGEQVKTGQEIGQVGSAGVAIGSHLHFEVRVGTATDYNAVYNPELWITPFADYGVVAGRVLNLDGHPLQGILVEAQSPQVYRSGYSYADSSVKGDLVLDENFAIPDLPQGYYTVYIKQNGTLLFRTMLYIEPNKVNWLDIYINPQ